jgi:hypothetical protein
MEPEEMVVARKTTPFVEHETSLRNTYFLKKNKKKLS